MGYLSSAFCASYFEICFQIYNLFICFPFVKSTMQIILFMLLVIAFSISNQEKKNRLITMNKQLRTALKANTHAQTVSQLEEFVGNENAEPVGNEVADKCISTLEEWGTMTILHCFEDYPKFTALVPMG